MAQATQAGVLSQAEAVAFANKLGMTLPEAVKAGYLSPAKVPGTYVITERGAGAVGVPVVGRLSPLQITALVAGVIGLTFVIVDFLDDSDGGGAAPVVTPTPTPSPTPVVSPTPEPPPVTTTTTLPATPTPAPTPVPTPSGSPGPGPSTSSSTSST
ncbi:MAG: hypothetical protein WC809_12420 [Sinimarinibacterium sp.]